MKKLQMMRKIISNYWSVLQINPELRESFQNDLFVVFKRKKSLKEIIGAHTIKNGKFLKPIQKTENENVNLATQINHYYVASMSLTLSTFRSYQTQQLYTTFHKLN